MMPMWSYHQWFRYPFATLPVQEWTHYSPWYASRYHCNYHIEEWSSRTKIGFSIFSLPHMKTSGYCHHQRQLLNLGKHCHYWFNSYGFGATCFNNGSACNDICHSKQRMIRNCWTLANIVITDSTRMDLVQHASTMVVHAMTFATQNKGWFAIVEPWQTLSLLIQLVWIWCNMLQQW